MAITTKSLTVDQWILVPDNPVQRDTIKHATRACRPGGHLSKPHESHQLVAMCGTPDGKKIWKLDGHSRCWLWEQELLTPAPKKLTVNFYTVANKQAAIDLYYHFDAQQAVENKRDKLFGAFRRYGFVPKHGVLMMNCGIMSAIEYTVFPAKWADLRNLPFTDMVKPWISNLKTFDNGGEYTRHEFFRSPVLTAALMSIRRDGNAACEFWQAYHDDTGRKSTATCDGIFAARSLFDTLQSEAKQRWGRHIHRQFSPYFLQCYNNWWEGKRMTKFNAVSSTKNKLPRGMLSVREWWETYLGELDHPQIRSEGSLVLQAAKAEKKSKTAIKSTKATEADTKQSELALA